MQQKIPKHTTLIFTEDFPYFDGGRAVYSFELSKIYFNYEKDIIVLTHLFTKDDLAFHRSLPFKVIRVPLYKSRWLRFVATALAFLRICTSYRIRKVYAVVWFKPGFITYLFSRFFNIEYYLMAFAYEVTAYRNPSLRRFIMKLTFKKAKLIFFM